MPGVPFKRRAAAGFAAGRRISDAEPNGGGPGCKSLQREAEENVMQILFRSSEGAGFARRVEVEEGTTIGQLFKQQMGESTDVGDFTVLVNREEVPEDQALKDGDRVSVVPAKVDGFSV